MNTLGLEARYINPFLESTLKVFNVMVLIKPYVSKPFVGRGIKIKDRVVTATILVKGEVLGSVRLILPEKVAMRICARLLGSVPQFGSVQMRDVAGELMNIILGGAQKFFIEQSEPFKFSIPTTRAGIMEDIYTPPKAIALYIPFYIDEGAFYLEICLVKQSAEKAENKQRKSSPFLKMTKEEVEKELSGDDKKKNNDSPFDFIDG